MYDTGTAADGRARRHRLLYLLEEFPSLGRLDFFSSQMRVMRGYGITALLIVQSFKDIINAYGRDQTIVDNCRIVVCFAAADPDTQKMISTMLGSANVEMSPTWSSWFSAIFRKIRRMIFPERVFGNPGAQWITSGAAIGPISFRTCWTNSFFNSSVYSSPAISVT